MIVLASAIIFFTGKLERPGLNIFEWMIVILGSLIVLYSYTAEFFQFLNEYASLKELIIGIDPKEYIQYSTLFTPQKFRWWVFLTGVGFHFLAVILYVYRCWKKS